MASLFTFVYILLVFFFFHETKKLAINKAEENMAGFLLNHNAIQHYVEGIHKPEIYRLKNEGKPGFHDKIGEIRALISGQ